MALVVCALSDTTPECPVISQVSGYVYERRLIEKWLNESGTDPMTGEELTLKQLTAMKVPDHARPAAPHLASIPAILKALQDEWDAVMLHAFTQRQQLQSARQELSHALYQHDAACRVVARLSREVASAREALASLVPHMENSNTVLVQEQEQFQSETDMESAEVESTEVESAEVESAEVESAEMESAEMELDARIGPDELEETAVEEAPPAPVQENLLSEEILQRLQDKATVLTLERKKKGKTIPENLISLEKLRTFQVIKSYSYLHSTGTPGILALDIHPRNNNRIVTGGVDRVVTVFDKDVEQIKVILKGHTKKVQRVAFHPDEELVLTGSADSTVRVWDISTGKALHMMLMHNGPITGLSLHPTGDYVLTASLDEHWAFSDIHTGTLLTKMIADEGGSAKLTTGQFHPDGLIFGTGTTNSTVKIWDLKERANVANFGEHSGAITAMSFSENGYYLATGAEDRCIRLWDLRKLRNFKTIQLEADYDIRDVCFDKSGTYLAVAGSNIRVFICKLWHEVVKFDNHKAITTSVRFGNNCEYIASTSMDRTVKMFGLNEE